MARLDSPHDRDRRNELLKRIALRVLVVLVPTVLVGALAIGLGVPAWIVVVACVLIGASVVFQS